ncbi:MAG: hypothetical protein RL258_1643 [Pseudomonadota bacterium]
MSGRGNLTRCCGRCKDRARPELTRRKTGPEARVRLRLVLALGLWFWLGLRAVHIDLRMHSLQTVYDSDS